MHRRAIFLAACSAIAFVPGAGMAANSCTEIAVMPDPYVRAEPSRQAPPRSALAGMLLVTMHYPRFTAAQLNQVYQRVQAVDPDLPWIGRVVHLPVSKPDEVTVYDLWTDAAHFDAWDQVQRRIFTELNMTYRCTIERVSGGRLAGMGLYPLPTPPGGWPPPPGRNAGPMRVVEPGGASTAH